MTAKKKVSQVVTHLPAGTEMSVHPGTMIQALMALPDVNVEKLEKMFELQERYETNIARKAYHEAMAKFGALIPIMTYDSDVSYDGKDGKPGTDYSFTSLAGSMKLCQPAMSECGLKATWKTESADSGQTKVTCFMTHALGHSEETSLSALPDPSGGKNAIQAVKSTVSYLKRITFEAIAGLATKKDDADDGKDSESVVKNITAGQVKSILAKISKVGAETKKILDLFKVDSVKDLTIDQYQPVHALLAAKAAVARNAEANK